MHTKSLFAMTLLLVGSQQLTACTIVDASDDTDTTADEPDAAATSDDSDDTSDDETTDEGSNASDAGSETPNDSDDSDDTNVTSDDEDAGASDSSDETTTDEEQGDGGDEGETPEGDGGGDTTDAQEGGDAGPVNGDVYKSGSIGLSQSITAIATVETVAAVANAGFNISNLGTTPNQPVGELPCTNKTVGQCTLMECEFSTDAGVDSDDDTGTQSDAVSAGAVKITGLADDVTLNSNEDGAYAPAQATSRWWAGGETLVASAPGSGDVPAFELELTAPAATLTAPELSILPVSTSRSTDMEVLWKDASAGTLSVSILDLDATPTARTITCSAPADSGGVTVDKSLLADFSDQAMVNAAIANTTTETVEDWSLVFTATSTVGSGMVNFED